MFRFSFFLSDAQDVADIVLEVEAMLGGMIADIKPEYSMDSVEGTNRPHRAKTLPTGVTKKESHFAQEIHRYPEVVERVTECLGRTPCFLWCPQSQVKLSHARTVSTNSGLPIF